MVEPHRIAESYDPDALRPEERRRNLSMGCVTVTILVALAVGVYWLASMQDRVTGEVTLPRLAELTEENERLLAELAEARAAVAATEFTENATAAEDPGSLGFHGMRLWVDPALHDDLGGLRLDTTIPATVQWRTAGYDIMLGYHSLSFTLFREPSVPPPVAPPTEEFPVLTFPVGNGQYLELPGDIDLAAQVGWAFAELRWQGTPMLVVPFLPGADPPGTRSLYLLINVHP